MTTMQRQMDAKLALKEFFGFDGFKGTQQQVVESVLRGEDCFVIMPTGAGKSLFLANLGINFAQVGMNVVYLTLELSEELVAMRMDAMVTGMATKDVFKNLDDVEMKVKILPFAPIIK